MAVERQCCARVTELPSRTRVLTDMPPPRKESPPLSELLKAARAQIASVRRDRDLLKEQIRHSQTSIARSCALLDRMNKLLASLDAGCPYRRR
jgi:hypothetical protein